VIALKPKFGPGDWFALPLPDENWAVGRIARCNGPALLGYFFGPRRSEVPALSQLSNLKAGDAIWIHEFGYLGLRNGDWPVLDGADEFDSAAWPMPMFGMQDLRGDYWGLYYLEDKPNTEFRRIRITQEEYERLPREGGAGHLYVCNWLNRILPPLES
jgi:hypothetical protein